VLGCEGRRGGHRRGCARSVELRFDVCANVGEPVEGLLDLALVDALEQHPKGLQLPRTHEHVHLDDEGRG
jgi:hypothetical protein